jgi:hypothetical protein
MAGKLRPLDVERETRPGKYFDGDGLYLVVKGATSRNWIYRYRKNGKERWLGLGSLKDVSLKNARMARDAARLAGVASLVSGRFAMIDNGLGFQLVPWQPLLEKRIGQHISGLQRDDGGIEWTFGRNRGLSL